MKRHTRKREQRDPRFGHGNPNLVAPLPLPAIQLKLHQIPPKSPSPHTTERSKPPGAKRLMHLPAGWVGGKSWVLGFWRTLEPKWLRRCDWDGDHSGGLVARQTVQCPQHPDCLHPQTVVQPNKTSFVWSRHSLYNALDIAITA